MKIMNWALNALPGLSSSAKQLIAKCASPRCRSRSGFPSLSLRSEGTHIGDDWYCGPECFEEAALGHIEKLCASRKFGIEKRRPRMSLGLTALSLGHITAEELKSGLEHQKQNGGRIGDALIALGAMTQAQLTGCLAAQWGQPVMSLRNLAFKGPQSIPTRLMELYSMLPVHYVQQSNKLVVGFAELIDYRIVATIETMLGCTVVPCFITRDEFDAAFQAIRLQDSMAEVVFDRRGSVQEIARIYRNYACQIGAMSARFAICCDYMWSRLQGHGTTIDVLSKV